MRVIPGNKRVFVVLLVICCFSIVAYLQTSEKAKLLERKKQIEKEIELTNRLLKDTREKRSNTVQELKLLQAKIRKRNALIQELNSDVIQLDIEIQEKTRKLQSYKGELEKTRNEYAELIYYAFKNRNTNLDFMYLLASDDINQFYARFKYLQQYKEYRLKSIQLIIQLKKLIEVEINDLISRKQEKVNMMNKILAEKAILVNDQSETDHIIIVLQQKESELKKQLQEKEKIRNKLEKEIEEIIRNEAKKKSYENLTPAERLVSDDFVKNKGRLPWPTEQGIITDRFGEHEHPVIKNIKVRNHGVDITTVPGAYARAVFGGVVTKVFSIKGANSTVIVRHGNFYTVYHNLEEVFVKAGDTVSVKQNIGKVYKGAKENESILHFEVWKELEKQDPEDWLSN